MQKIFLPLLLIVLFCACKESKPVKLNAGIWRGVIQTNGGDLPFSLDIQPNEDSCTYIVHVLNGNEKLRLDTATVWGDSLMIPMEIFDAQLITKVENKQMTGFWKKKRTDGTILSIPFSAKFGETHRFLENPKTTENLTGKWQTIFTSETDTTQAIGVFEQNGTTLTGTFLTATGDYRFLAGNVVRDSLLLSCFDGTHAFLFKAKLDKSKQKLSGQFWSNGTNLENWTAERNENAILPDAKSLTFLKDKNTEIKFSFPDLTGKMVSLQDEQFKNKVVILQVLGSWCPNCMDETKFLAPWYQKNKNRGVEIIGLAFEKNTDLKIAAPKLEKLKKRFDIDYTILLAGKNNKDSASVALPALSKIMSFPTTVFIDRKGKVREIHTGFSGPGTGKYYDSFMNDFEILMEKLLRERE